MGERFEADFRKAMRRLASAVTVISTRMKAAATA